MKDLWDKIIHLIPFDEAGYDLLKILWMKFFGKGKRGEDSSTSTPVSRIDPRDKLNETLEGIASYWALIPVKERKTLDRALKRLPQEKQDAAEHAVGRMLGQLKNGIFPAVMKKVTKDIPHQQKGKKGTTRTVWKKMTIEGLTEKKDWDPGVIFVKALTRAGETSSTADRFWEMMLQVSPIQRAFQALSEWLSTKRNGFRNFRLVVGAVAILLTVSLLFGIVAIPTLAYRLAIGNAISASGVEGLLWSILFPIMLLILLAPLGFVLLRLMGFAPARRKYWSVIAFLAVVGLATRLLTMVTNLSEHELLAPIAVISIAILAWNGVYHRLTEGDSKGGALNTLATIMLVVTIVAMLIPSRLYAGESSHLTGLEGWCRPNNISGITDKNGDRWEWPEKLPPNVPRKFRCNEVTEEGLDPLTFLPAIPFTAKDALKLLEWEAREPEPSIVVEEVQAPRERTYRRRTVDLSPGQGKDLTVKPGETVRVNNLARHYLQGSQMSGCILFRLDGKGDFRQDCPGNWIDLPAFRFIEYKTPAEDEVSLRVSLHRQ